MVFNINILLFYISTWNTWTGYAVKRNSKTSDNKLQTHRNNQWTDKIYNQDNTIIDISTKLKTYIETTFINEISLCNNTHIRSSLLELFNKS
jgi:uncharacterized membrane protein